jgi:hypothetical protein
VLAPQSSQSQQLGALSAWPIGGVFGLDESSRRSVAIPQDVLDLLRRIFGDGNAEVASILSRQPMSREDHLDQALITYLDRQSPKGTPHSGWIVDCETHFLGSGRHFGVWEIADIGVLVILRRGKTAVWSKVAVLQSKRLFPVGSKHDEDAERARFRWGFGRLHGSYDVNATRRTYDFSEESLYASLDLRSIVGHPSRR